MPNAVWIISYKLVVGSSVPDFLLASEDCNREVLSKKAGFVSWKQLFDGETWVDFVSWETMEDAKNAEKEDGNPSPFAQKFYSFIDFKSLKMRPYSVERSY
jgi:hypothetical protein